MRQEPVPPARRMMLDEPRRPRPRHAVRIPTPHQWPGAAAFSGECCARLVVGGAPAGVSRRAGGPVPARSDGVLSGKRPGASCCPVPPRAALHRSRGATSWAVAGLLAARPVLAARIVTAWRRRALWRGSGSEASRAGKPPIPCAQGRSHGFPRFGHVPAKLGDLVFVQPADGRAWCLRRCHLLPLLSPCLRDRVSLYRCAQPH